MHRDLKPANVVIDGRGRARITDFESAGATTQFVGESAPVDTPAYMSPEQSSGQELTPRSDIYPLGLILYEIFTGRPAFTAATLPEMLRMKQSATVTNPSGLVPEIDPAIERTILACLLPDQDRRPASVFAVAAALRGPIRS